MSRESTVICRKCGASLESDDESAARFCPGCGASFGPGASLGMKLGAVGAILLGVLVLVGAAWRGLASESVETQLLRADVLGLEKKASDRQTDLEALGRERDVLNVGYRQQRETLKKKREELATCEAEIVKLAAANREQVSRANAKLEAARKRLSESKTVAGGILRKEAEQTKRKERMMRLMDRYRHLCVTLTNSDRVVCSGFFFNNGKASLLVTSDAMARTGKKVYAKFTFTRGGKPFVTKRTFCRLMRRDTKRGLAFYRPVMQRGWTITCIASRATAGASVGEQVFAIATNVVGGKVLDHTIHDGTVSSTDRKVNGFAHVQTTLPYNPGAPGAPVINADGKLVGVLIKGLGKLEKSSLAICASEVSKSASGR